jgi:hypothetical protein
MRILPHRFKSTSTGGLDQVEYVELLIQFVDPIIAVY